MPSHAAEAQALADWINQKLDGKTFDRKPHTHIAATYFAISLETHRAIAVLMREDLRSSATALARVQFESYVRGLWVLQCCNDQKAVEVFEGKFHIGIDKMIKQIEATPGYGHKMLSTYKNDTWSMMSQFAHTGQQQLQRWITDNEIGPRHSNEEMLAVAKSGALFACLAAMGLAWVFDDRSLGEECIAKLQEHSLVPYDHHSDAGAMPN